MALPRIECEVVFGSDPLRVGEYANAFRVMADSPQEVILDFCLYSAATNTAKVVSRVRVQRSFLAFVDARLREALLEFEADQALRQSGMVRDPVDGTLLLMGPESEDTN